MHKLTSMTDRFTELSPHPHSARIGIDQVSEVTYDLRR